MKLRKFKSGDNFFFQMLNDASEVILESQAYTSKDDRDKGIESVKVNIKNTDRYKAMTEGGKHFFILRAGNNQEVARSVRYDSNADMKSAISYVQGESSDEGEYSTDGVTDDYKPIAYYEERSKGVKDGFVKFYADGESYFSYKIDGVVYMISEGYKSESSRDNGIASVKKNMVIDERYEFKQHENGSYYFNLKAGNHQEIATSRWLDDEGLRAWVVGKLNGKGGGTDPGGANAKVAPKKKRKKRDKKPKVEKVILSTGSYPCSDITYQVFKSGNDKFYFTYRDANEKAILINNNIRGFNSEADINPILASIAANGSKADRFEVKTTVNDKFYFYLKNDEGKNIGKSFFFDTQEEMKATMKLFDCGLAVSGGVSKVAAVASHSAAISKSEKVEDDYLGCKAYQSHISDKHSKHKDFVVFTEGDEHYFAWVNGNDIVMRSEGYTTEKARENGIESVIKNREIEKRFSVDEKMGYYFTVLKAGNHQEIARSCPEKDRERAMFWFPSSIKKRNEEVEAAAVVTAKPEKREDDYLHCSYYTKKERSNKYSEFSVFERNGEFYFALLDNNGEVVLRSEGYKSEKGRENGIQSVIKNREIEKRWSVKENRGVYFHVLKAGNHQEIGRSCPMKDKPKGAFMWGSWAAGVAAATAIATIPKAKSTITKPKDKEDDYLACKEYEGKPVNDKQNNVALFKHGGDGQYYFVLYNESQDVKLRSEGFESAKERDEELSGVLKYHENKDMYKRIIRGKYYMDVLYDKNGREVGRSCLKTEKKAVPLVAAGTAVAAATGVDATPKKKIVASAVEAAPVIEETSGGGFKWWWLLLPLFLLLGWFLCNKCQTEGSMAEKSKVELNENFQEEKVAGLEESGVESNARSQEEKVTGLEESDLESNTRFQGEKDDAVEEHKKVVAGEETTSAAGCQCESRNISIFNVPSSEAISVDRLGTLPEFGDSHGLTPSQFYSKLSDRYRSNNVDRAYLDYVFRSMGYPNGFSSANASLFSNVTLDRGQSGLLGFGTYHGFAHHALNTSERDRRAFLIQSANGCDVHFMKTCGNYMFFCE